MILRNPLQFWLVCSLLVVSLSAFAGEESPCDDEDVVIDFGLVGTENDPDAEGAGIYSLTDCEAHLVIEVAGISEADGVLIYIDDVLVDDVAVVEGEARLELDSLEGDEVPEVTEESFVEVVAAGGEVVLLTSEEEEAPLPCEFFEVVFDFELFGTENDPEAFGFGIFTAVECETRLVVEMEGITASDGVLLFIDGEFVEDAVVTAGEARIELDTVDGDAVPFFTEESEIIVIAALAEYTPVLTNEEIDEEPPGCEEADLEFDFELIGTEADPEAFGSALYLTNDCYPLLIIELAEIASTEGVFIVIDGEFIEDLPIVEGGAVLVLNSTADQEVPFVEEGSVIEVFAAGTEELILTSEEGEGEDGIEEAIDVHLIGTDADPGAEGIAVYTVDGEIRRFEVEVEGITAADAVDVFVDGVFAGFGAVIEGFAYIERDTSEGHEVPIVTDDSLVEVIRNDSDEVLLSSHLIYVDFDMGTTHASGGEVDPVDTLGTALAIVQETGVIRLSPGTSVETPTINQQVRLERDGASGIVQIGVSSARATGAESGFVSRGHDD